MRSFVKLSFAIMALSIVAATAHADTLSFGPAVIPTPTPFTTYTQDGFTVTQGTGQFVENIAQGNPPEGLSGGNIISTAPFSTNSVVVTDHGTEFYFTGFDLDAYAHAASYTLTGMLGSTVVYSVTMTDSTTSSGNGTWVTLAPAGLSSDEINSLTISITDNTASSEYAIDNIVVTAPEPSSLFLFGTGLLGLAGIARRRFAR